MSDAELNFELSNIDRLERKAIKFFLKKPNGDGLNELMNQLDLMSKTRKSFLIAAALNAACEDIMAERPQQ